MIRPGDYVASTGQFPIVILIFVVFFCVCSGVESFEEWKAFVQFRVEFVDGI